MNAQLQFLGIARIHYCKWQRSPRKKPLLERWKPLIDTFTRLRGDPHKSNATGRLFYPRCLGFSPVRTPAKISGSPPPLRYAVSPLAWGNLRDCRGMK